MADEWNWDGMLMATEDISIDDELRGTGEVHLSKKTNKTKEEIESFSIPDDLDEIDRNLHILKNGTIVQKLSVVNSFSALFNGEFRERFRDSILPLCLSIAQSESLPFQRDFANQLLEIIHSLTVPKISSIIQVSKQLIANRNEDVANVWKKVHIECIKRIPEDFIKQQILPEILEQNNLSQSVSLRLWRGRLMCAVTGRMNPNKVDQLVFDNLLGLCDDTDMDVRKNMCLNLTSTALSLGLKLTKKYLFEEYNTLLSDEEVAVQEAALTSVMDICQIFDAETKTTFLIPLWKRICEESNPKLSDTVLQLFGPFFWYVREELNPIDKQFFITFYQTNVATADMVNMKTCLYNFPAIIAAIKPQNFETFKLDKTLALFEAEDDFDIQKTLAMQFHELCSQLGQNSFRLLKESFMALLSSNNEAIIEIIFQHMDKILTCFHSEENIKNQVFLDLVLNKILDIRKQYDDIPTIKWRQHEKILSSFKVFPLVFDSESVYEQCVPVLLRILFDPFPATIKKLSCELLVVFMRRLKRSEYQEMILRQLLELRDDRSCHMRLLFFDVCEYVLKVFSQKFFRHNFFYGYLGLSRDSVANIRLRYISLLPLVRHCIRIPADNSLLTKLIDATEPLATRDQDGDVISAMNHFYKRHGLLHMQNCCQFVKERDFVIDESDFKGLRKASESMDSLTDYYLLDYPSWEKMDDDALDRQKEEQEHKLLFFQLDPTKKKMEEKKEMLEKKHAGLKKVDTVKKVLPKKMSTNNKMQQLDVDPSVPKPKRKESIVLPTTPSDPLLRKQDELKSFETETKKGTRIEPRSAQKQAKPTDIRAQSKSAGVRLNK